MSNKSVNVGKQNELNILKCIDGKEVGSLPAHFQKGILQMYKVVSKNDVVKATKYSDWDGNKPDIKIELTNHDKYLNISIKTGWTPSLHQENFYSFLNFLRTLQISNETINTLIFYHHADDTYDGTGVDKLRFDQFREKYKERIAKASEELSQEHIVKAVAYRAIIAGREEKRMKVNYLYHGTEVDGFFVHREDLLNKITSVGREKYTALHFGPMVYVAKIPNKCDQYGNKYQYAQLIWPKMDEDLKKIYDSSYHQAIEFKQETTFDKIKRRWKNFSKKYLE